MTLAMKLKNENEDLSKQLAQKQSQKVKQEKNGGCSDYLCIYLFVYLFIYYSSISTSWSHHCISVFGLLRRLFMFVINIFVNNDTHAIHALNFIGQ